MINAIPESAAGLQSQLEAILGAVEKHDSKQFEDLINDLEVLENSHWFTASWSTYEDQVGSMFRSIGTVKKIPSAERETSAH
jgi:hypothetical protein